MNEHMVIPGMESLVPTKPKVKLSIRQEMAELQRRLLRLELEVSLLRILLEKCEKDHA